MWGKREITRCEWVTARAPIEKRLDTAKRRLAAINRTTELAPHLGNAQELREQWETMTLSRQKQIVAALLRARRRRAGGGAASTASTRLA